MGQTQSNIPKNNLIIQLHLQNQQKVIELLEAKFKDPIFNINKPINRVLLEQYYYIYFKKLEDTYLHYAAYKKDKVLVEYLKKKGADPYAKNSRGLTPIDVTDDVEVKKLLERKL